MSQKLLKAVEEKLTGEQVDIKKQFKKKRSTVKPYTKYYVGILLLVVYIFALPQMSKDKGNKPHSKTEMIFFVLDFIKF